MSNEDMISIADIRKIITDEIKDIQAMKPENDENLITVNVIKQHYTAECRAIMSRIIEFVNCERGDDICQITKH